MSQGQRRVLSDQICCLCGLRKCSESIDHNFMSIKEFKILIEKSKVPNIAVDELRHKIDTFYKKLKYELQTLINRDHRLLQQHFTKFYYSHLNPQHFNLDDLCQFANGCYDKLPSKKALKIINVIQRKDFCQLESEVNGCELKQLKDSLNKYLQQFSKKKQFLKLKDLLPYEQVIQKSQPEIKLKKSLSEISNPQETDEQINSIYMWKNVQIKSKTKVLQLSNKAITDSQLLKQMPKISSFRNIQNLQVRNNKITPFSCKMIASNMPFLKLVDIRSNKVGDEGVLHIVKGIPDLKSLMISQTGCTNISLKAILSLQNLQMLWCEQNPVDGLYAIQITNMPKLRVLSFAGCKLDPSTIEKVKKIFTPKGYVTV